MAATFKSFDLIRLDASGGRIELPNETLTIKKVSDDTTIQTVESDAFGYIASEEISASPGEEIYFEHATYPEIFYQTAGAAESDAVSEFATFIVENLFASTSDAVAIDIYIKESGSENIDYLGTMSPNSIASFPKEVNTSKDFTLYSVPRDSSGQRRTTDFTQTKTESLSVTVRRFGYAIKDFFADASNAGSSTDLFATAIPADTLIANGDKILAFFSGTIADNEDLKNVWVKFNGEYIYPNSNFTQADGTWRAKVFIIRNSSNSARSTVRFERFAADGSASVPLQEIDAVSSLDFAATINLILGAGGEASADIVSKMGYVKFEPAAITEEEGEGGEAGETYDTDSEAFFTATGITDETIKGAIDGFVTDLKDANIWSKFYALYPWVGGVESTIKYNLKDPRDADDAFRLTFSGTWSHSANGSIPTNSHADTHFNPSVHGTSWITSNSLSFYSRTSAASSDGWVMGVGNTSNGNPLFGLAIRRTGNACYFDSGNIANGRVTTSTSDAAGLTTGTCTGASAREIYQNGTSLASSTATDSAGASNANIYLGSMNPTAGTEYFQNHECAFAAIGQSLNDSEAAALNTIVSDFQTALGR